MHPRKLAHLLLLVIQSAITGVATGQNQPTATWAHGTVRDQAGKAIAGAKVYARATYHGGIRMNALLKRTLANEQGHYRIEGQGELSAFSAVLVAHVPGRPPALAWIAARDHYFEDGSGKSRISDTEVDLVIPDRGAALEVHVTREARPAEDVWVSLRLEGADPFDLWGLPLENEFHREFQEICRPAMRTWPGGVAHFEMLLPGQYRIGAAADKQRAIGLTDYSLWFPFEESPAYGLASHVPVPGGTTSTHRLAMFPQGGVVQFEIFHNGSKWDKDVRLGLSVSSLYGRSYSTSLGVGDRPSDRFRFERSGIQRVDIVQSTGSESSPRRYPFISATSAIAASPRLSTAPAVKMEASENHGPSILVRIQDAEGRPATGFARFVRTNWGSGGWTAVGLDGSRITGIQAGTGRLEAYTSEENRQVLTEHTGQIPADAVLTGREEILPHPLTLSEKEEVEVTLRAEKVGYARGSLSVPAGESTQDYRVVIGPADIATGAGIYYQTSTGQFVAGPYRSGTANFALAAPNHPTRDWLASVEIEAGKVAQTQLQTSSRASDLVRQTLVGKARIFLADRKTPAPMAAYARYLPGEKQVVRIGTADSFGRFQLPRFGFLSYYAYTLADTSSSPREPLIIAWLPGTTGAAMVPLAQNVADELSIVLPPPVTATGTVTVAGEGDTVENGTLSILAQYQGRGVLNEILSVETTAAADGRFVLSGLTAGEYVVQAALDQIWLSESKKIKVSDNGTLTGDPLSLRIDPPGGPVRVHLPHGLPPHQAKVFVRRPIGPLNNRYWPRFFLPDGAGTVHIPALEAGQHVLSIADRLLTVDVPTIAESRGLPAELNLTQ